MGPWITPTDDIPNPNNLSIKLWVNKSLKQDSSSHNMIVSFEGLISYISERVTLFPGDLIATGTPAGCGAIQKQSLKEGDVVRIEVDGLGELINSVQKNK
jgi:2-keto-4-pentenoate hydratase/2-oxohepta-3-ene-1,7-dioic acid hydratase in catechol pathway